MSTNPELWKKPGPKGQRESRVQTRDPTGRERRFAHQALADVFAKILPAPKVRA